MFIQGPASNLLRHALLVLMLALLGLFLTGCGPEQLPSPSVDPAVQTPDSTSQNVSPSTPIPTEPAATPTPVPLTPRAILFAPPEADQVLVTNIEGLLEDLAAQLELDIETVSSLTVEELESGTRLVIALNPADNVAELALSAQQVQFLAIGISGLKAGGNLSLIEPALDLQGFMAGYIAAITTSDWRIGALTIAGTPEGQASRQGFVTGGIYFCGLCRQVYPPFYDADGVYIKYPLSYELPQAATNQDRQAAADYLIDRGVKTIYLAPGIEDQTLVDYLKAAGIAMIGSGEPPPSAKSHWVASISTGHGPGFEDILLSLLTDEGGFSVPGELRIDHINFNLFTEGRYQLAVQVMTDLEEGFIASGADNQATENGNTP
jgi:hypothetical protein